MNLMTDTLYILYVNLFYFKLYSLLVLCHFKNLIFFILFVTGSSPELMPSIMGAFDAIIGTSTNHKDSEYDHKTSTPRRSHQISNFANLSPYVQKVLSNVPEQEISKKFTSDETLGPKRFGSNRSVYRSFRSPEKSLNKSNEHLEIISSNVQKMLSNLPDTELVISATNLTLTKNSSYLFSSNSRTEFLNKILTNGEGGDETLNGDGKTNGVKQFLYHSDGVGKGENGYVNGVSESEQFEDCDSYNPRPLGSYLHSSLGIASRTPVGRKNLGKYLQVRLCFFFNNIFIFIEMADKLELCDIVIFQTHHE